MSQFPEDWFNCCFLASDANGYIIPKEAEYAKISIYLVIELISNFAITTAIAL